eukprot:2182649-Prorocentrum_lima.AAC.1
MDIACLGHYFHLEIDRAFAAVQLVPKLHATSFCFTMPGVYSLAMKALRRMLEHDLGFHGGLFPGCPPPAEKCVGRAGNAATRKLHPTLPSG